MNINMYIWLLLFCVVLCSIGRRLQGGLIDRIFFGKKLPWKTVNGVAVKPTGKLREKEGTFGTTKARLVFASISIFVWSVTIAIINNEFYDNIKICIPVIVIGFLLLFLGQTFGAFGSLNAGWVRSSEPGDLSVYFDKKLAVKHFIGLSLMGFSYCLFPVVLSLLEIIVYHNYIYIAFLLLPFLWYFGYYFAWKYPTNLAIFETQYDDPPATGELLTGAILGLYLYLTTIFI